MKKDENWVRVDIPMPRQLKETLKTKAKEMGFDSLQAYVRFFAKAAVEGHSVDFSTNTIPSNAAMMRWFAAQETFLLFQNMTRENIAVRAEEDTKSKHESEENKLMQQILHF